MLEWHDCKSDPPSKEGQYVLTYRSVNGISWVQAHWSQQYQRWQSPYEIYYEKDCYKWAEVELPD